MDSPGKYLKQEREARDLRLEDVSRATRIKKLFLRAIEEDRYDLCPSPFYVKAFLGSYARHLGLDPTQLLSKYLEMTKPPAPSPSEVAVEQPPETSSKLHTRTAFRLVLLSTLFVSLLIPLYFLIQLPFPMFKLTVSNVHRQGSSVTERERQDPTFPGREENIPPEVVSETERPPALEEFKGMELIGPREVLAEPFCRIVEAELGTGIETEGGRPQLVGKGSEFNCDNQRVYFFTRILTAKEAKIFHVWRREGEEIHRVEMSVRPPAWSVYSYVTLPASRFGNWNVEVWDGDKVLTDLTFKAHQAESPLSVPKKS